MEKKSLVAKPDVVEKHYSKHGYDIQESASSLCVLQIKGFSDPVKITQQEFQNFISAKPDGTFSIKLGQDTKTIFVKDVIGYSVKTEAKYFQSKTK